MTLMLLGQYFLIMRSSMVDVMTEDFITVKRATGLPRDRVDQPPRGAQRAAAAGDPRGDPVRRGRRRRDHDRDDLLLARPRRAQLQRDQRQGLPRPAGHVPRLQRRRDPRQPRSPTASTSSSTRGCRRDERRERRASAEAACSAPGAAASASACSALFAFLAIFGSADRARRSRTPRASTCSPSPSWTHPLGTTESGADVLLAAARRRPRLDRRRLRGGADLGRARLGRRPRRRLLRRLDRPHPRRARELVPGDPDAAADDRPRAAARPLADGADRGHRPDLVGGDRADRPRPGADPARAGVRRAGEGARRQRHATSSRPTSCPTRCR